MRIVAAGMHDAGYRAFEGKVPFFDEAEGVNIGAQADGRA